MMANTRKVMLYGVSVIYLLLVTVLSGYATSRIRQLSLPIPQGLTYSTTILPLFSAALLELAHFPSVKKTKKPQQIGSPMGSPVSVILNTLVIIYSTAVITLLGTYAAPLSDSDCNLRERWSMLFHEKNAAAVRTIQDTFQCCGFKVTKDMAWPFPDKEHGGNACEVAFGRIHSCLEGWKGEEYRLAGILMAVVGLVSLWQVCFVLFRARGESWLHQIVPGHVSRMINQSEDDGSETFQPRITYAAQSERYSDRVDTAEEDVEDANDAQRLLKGDIESGRTAEIDGSRGKHQVRSLSANA